MIEEENLGDSIDDSDEEMVEEQPEPTEHVELDTLDVKDELEKVVKATAKGFGEDIQDILKDEFRKNSRRIQELGKDYFEWRVMILKESDETKRVLLKMQADKAFRAFKTKLITDKLVVKIRTRDALLKRLSLFGDAAFEIGKKVVKLGVKASVSSLAGPLGPVAGEVIEKVLAKL